MGGVRWRQCASDRFSPHIRMVFGGGLIVSRNLCTSSCCDNTVRLSDLRGKPIEFRRYGKEPPLLGTRWDCPACGTAYFAIWRGAEFRNHNHHWGNFVIDLSYYESFDDEHGDLPAGLDNPAYLCLDDAEDTQETW